MRTSRPDHAELWLRLTLCAFAALVLALPASAKIVEFDALLKAGLGDGGDPPSTPAFSPNGLPICQKGLVTHLNASVPAHGFAEVSSGPAPQAVEDVRPFRPGGPGPTGPFPLQSMPGVAGDNGAAFYESSTCVIAFTPAFLPPVLNARTQSSRFSWPAHYTFTFGTASTLMGGTAMRNVTGTALSTHRVAAGEGPGDYSVLAVPTFTAFLSNVAGPNQFGGGFRASGGGRVNLNVNLAPGLSATGYWLSGPRFLGHHKTPITQILSQSGTFTTNLGAGMIQVALKAWLMPLTTGMVHMEDHGGTFVTIRNSTGFDNRTSMGEMGTLLLVSPWVANLANLNLYFGGTGSLEFQFLPEPGPSLGLAAGVLAVLGLHLVARRRR